MMFVVETSSCSVTRTGRPLRPEFMHDLISGLNCLVIIGGISPFCVLLTNSCLSGSCALPGLALKS